MFLIIFSTHSDTFVVYVYWGWRCDLGLFLFLNVKNHDYLHFTKSTSTSVSTPILCLTRFQTPQLWLFMRIPWRGLLSSLPFFSCAHNHVSIIFRRHNTDYYSIKETQKLWNWKNVAFEYFVEINFLRMECKDFFVCGWHLYRIQITKQAWSNRSKSTWSSDEKQKEIRSKLKKTCAILWFALKNRLIHNLWTRDLKWKQSEYFRYAHSFSAKFSY